jgi:peptidyl-prolyl cis-trans isomerase C
MKRPITGAALALALALPAVAQDQDVDAGTVLATVNGTEITLGHLIAMRGRLPAQYQNLPDDVLYQGMLDQLIQQQVLADAAREDLGRADALGLENEQRAYLAGRVIDRAATAPLDEAEVESLYEESFGAAEPATEWNASHILVETEEEAQDLVARLEEGADFAELAREESTGPSGPGGGSLGWFAAGMMVPEFEQAVQSLEPGEVSEPIQTQFGWHVVKLNDTRQQEAPPLDAVREQIEQQLRTQAVDAELERLTGQAEIDRAEVTVDPALIRDADLIAE